LLSGKVHIWQQELHAKYGPVVRYAPDELSFIDGTVWKEAYGHGSQNFPKDPRFYGLDAAEGRSPGLIASDNESHARQRKIVAHAFSDKALREQESLLKSYTELLLKQLRKTIGKDGTSKVDLTQWYNFTTFDIMGDLTFGEPLHLLDDTTYTPWVSSIFGNTHLAVVALVLRAWGLEKYINAILPASVKDKRKLHQQHSITRVEKRLAKDTDRPDIWTYVLRNSGKENNEGLVLTKPEMHNNAGLFMLAGTETTATELSGMTYYLLQNPQKLARLTKEIRDAFMAYEDVTINKLSELKYLDACIHEGLRVYPPVAFGLPRASPPGGANVNGQFVAGGVGRSPSILCLINDANGCRLQFNSLSTLPTTHPIISRIPTTLSRSDGCPRDRMSTTQIIRKPCNPSLSDRATVWARSK
jgi:hypothetical protein